MLEKSTRCRRVKTGERQVMATHTTKEMPSHYMTKFLGFIQSMKKSVGYSAPEEKGTMFP
jgi:hypothetical protein